MQADGHPMPIAPPSIAPRRREPRMLRLDPRLSRRMRALGNRNRNINRPDPEAQVIVAVAPAVAAPPIRWPVNTEAAGTRKLAQGD